VCLLGEINDSLVVPESLKKNSDGIFKDFYGYILRLDVPWCKLKCISKDQI